VENTQLPTGVFLIFDLWFLDLTFDLSSSRKMIADIFGESGDEEEEEFTVSSSTSEFH